MSLARFTRFPNERGLGHALLVLAGLVQGPATIRANDIEVTNVTVETIGDSVSRVEFDITWANSWRTINAPGNRDAAWIFVKYLNAVTHTWEHAYLANGGHTTPFGVIDHLNGREVPGAAFDPVANRSVGVFLHRFGNGSGPFTAQGVRLVWDRGPYGIGQADIDSVKVFAIEMVYIPQGAYYLGSGGSELGHFYTYPDESSPYQVTSEAEIPIAAVPGALYYPDTLTDPNPNYHWGDQLGPIEVGFPKGFAPFYMMKHEVAQRDFVDFLNCLTRVQQSRHTGHPNNNALLAPGVTTVNNTYVMCNSGTSLGRQKIRCDEVVDPDAPVVFYCDGDGDGVGNEVDDGQWVACNYLHWRDLAAYLDWCGLRPMTELEFVKAGRGALQTPVPNEYVWGNTSAIPAGALANMDLINEQCPTTGANAVYNNLLTGPVRTGVFAAVGTDRAQAGAGYYGVLDLGGNVGELAVTIGFPNGRAFDGSLGDGGLDSLGLADEPTWPVTGYFSGIGVLGGAWILDNTYMRLSDRHTASHFTYTSRSGVNGGRGVRDAPVE